MCVISFYRPRVMPNTNCLHNGAMFNPDGHGYAIIAGDRIITGKGMDADAVIDAFVKIRHRHPDSYALFHSRITTHGGTDEDNCHPFLVGGDPRTVLAHNGILPSAARPRKGDSRSDTRILAEDWIPQGRFGHLSQRRARRRLTRFIGSESYPNKLVILTVDPAYGQNAYLINERYGEWSDGVWWSNDSYLPLVGLSLPSMWWKDDTITRGRRDEAALAEAGYYDLERWQLWDMYRRGELTYDEYYWCAYGEEPPSLSRVNDTPMALERPTSGDCHLCGAKHSVNLTMGICRQCMSCVDCEDLLVDCQCFTPDMQATVKKMVESAEG